ncbi:MAG: hypothetical protein IJ173_05725 [Kiritimatiellae bacterium]|nr:hypothetical protein [Kiritimatiellia bacterium]
MKRKLTEMITRSLAFVLSLGIASGAWADNDDVLFEDNFPAESVTENFIFGTITSDLLGTTAGQGGASAHKSGTTELADIVTSATKSDSEYKFAKVRVYSADNNWAKADVLYALPSTVTSETAYTMEFDWYGGAGYNASGTYEDSINAFAIVGGDGSAVTTILIPSEGHNDYTVSATIYDANGIAITPQNSLTCAPRNGDPAATAYADRWYHFTLKSSPYSGTKLSITRMSDSAVILSDYSLSEGVVSPYALFFHQDFGRLSGIQALGNVRITSATTKLNAPTLYRRVGVNYLYVEASQSNVDGAPTPTIRYTVSTKGNTVYSANASSPDGKVTLTECDDADGAVITCWASCNGYVDSDPMVINISNLAKDYCLIYTLDYAKLFTENTTWTAIDYGSQVTLDADPEAVRYTLKIKGTDFYLSNPLYYNYETKTTNGNTSSIQRHQISSWNDIRALSGYSTTKTPVITGLKKGDIVNVIATNCKAGTGLEASQSITSSNYENYFTVTSDNGIAYFELTKPSGSSVYAYMFAVRIYRPAVAMADGVGYATLQEAANNAAEGATITLKASTTDGVELKRGQKLVCGDYTCGTVTTVDGYAVVGSNGTYTSKSLATPETWEGTADNYWNNAANWSEGFVPTAATPVTIPSGDHTIYIGNYWDSRNNVRDVEAYCAGMTLNGNLTVKWDDGQYFVGCLLVSGPIAGEGTLTLKSAGIYNNTTSALEISCPLVLEGKQFAPGANDTWTAYVRDAFLTRPNDGCSNDFAIKGDVTLNGYTRLSSNITLDEKATLTINGADNQSTGTGAYNGDVVVNGAFYCNGASQDSFAGAITFGNDARLDSWNRKGFNFENVVMTGNGANGGYMWIGNNDGENNAPYLTGTGLTIKGKVNIQGQMVTGDAAKTEKVPEIRLPIKLDTGATLTAESAVTIGEGGGIGVLNSSDFLDATDNTTYTTHVAKKLIAYVSDGHQNFDSLASAWEYAGKGADGKWITLRAQPTDSITLAAGQAIVLHIGSYDLSDVVKYGEGLKSETTDKGSGFTMYSAREYYTWTVMLVNENGATVTGIANGGTVNEASPEVTFSVTPAANYRLDSVMAGETALMGTEDNGTYTYTYTLTGDTTITVNTDPNGVTLGTPEVTWGADFTNAVVTATVANGYSDVAYTLTYGQTTVAGLVADGTVTFNVPVAANARYADFNYSIEAAVGDTSVGSASGKAIVADKKAWFSTTASATTNGAWNPQPTVDGSKMTFTESNTFTPNAASSSKIVVLNMGNVCFGDTNDAEISDAQAGIRIGESGKFEVLTTNNAWLETLVGANGDAEYDVVVTINYATKKYSVTVGENTISNIDLAGNKTQVESIEFQGDGSLASLTGEYFDGAMVKDSADKTYDTVAEAIAALKAGTATAPLTILHIGTPPAGWTIENDVLAKASIEVKSEADKTLVAVPQGCTSIDTLIDLSNRYADDQIQAYDSKTGKFNTWKLSSEKVWTGVGRQDQDDAQPVFPTEEDKVLKAGQAVWVLRMTEESKAAPIRLNASYADAPATVALETGWNLVAPTVDVEDLNSLDIVATATDRIVVPSANGGAPAELKYKNGKWGYNTAEEDESGHWVLKFKTEGITIPAGTGFWYVSDSDKDISL